MDGFEEFVGKVDEEIMRLHRYLEKEFAPEAERHAAEILRKVSGKLSNLAAEMEAHLGRGGIRDAAQPSTPSAAKSSQP